MNEVFSKMVRCPCSSGNAGFLAVLQEVSYRACTNTYPCCADCDSCDNRDADKLANNDRYTHKQCNLYEYTD